MLSGDLIEVTSGTLVLLGISGAVTVGSRMHDNRQASPDRGVAPGYPESDPALWSWLFSPALAISGEAYSSFSVVK